MNMEEKTYYTDETKNLCLYIHIYGRNGHITLMKWKIYICIFINMEEKDIVHGINEKFMLSST